jgi:uncharacterized iron-regulated membrane protein
MVVVTGGTTILSFDIRLLVSTSTYVDMATPSRPITNIIHAASLFSPRMVVARIRATSDSARVMKTTTSTKDEILAVVLA